MADNIIQFYWPSTHQDSQKDTDPEALKMDDNRDKTSAIPLPSFEHCYGGRNDSNLSSDHSTAGSDCSFSIANLINSVQRSSTPNVLLDTVLSQPVSNTQMYEKSASSETTDKRKSDKPPYTYIAMCIMAIETSPKKALTFEEIRVQLQKMFPFFKGSYKGWRESIRGCLYRSKILKRVHSLAGLRQSYWTVDHTKLTPAMFRKQASKDCGHHYKEYLHEELGVQSICPGPQTHQYTGTPSLKNMILPDVPCYQPPLTTTTEPTDSDDFLHARKDVDCETGYEKCGVSSNNSAFSGLESNAISGKRKCDSDLPENTAKKPRNDTNGTTFCDSVVTVNKPDAIQTGLEHTDSMNNTAMVNKQSDIYTMDYWNNVHNYGQYQGTSHQSYSYYPHYHQYNYDQQHRTPVYYPNQWQAAMHHGHYTPYHYNAQAAQVQYQTMLNGYNFAQQLLHRYQQFNTQTSTSGDYQYDYQWYSAPTGNSSTALDLSTSSSDAE